MRLIDADKIKYDDMPIVNVRGIVVTRKAVMQRAIEDMPTIERPERPKGKWILKEYYIPVKQTALPTVCKSEYDFFTSPTAVESKYMYICPYCKKEYTSQANFCPNCGAEMEV